MSKRGPFGAVFLCCKSEHVEDDDDDDDDDADAVIVVIV